MCPCTFTVERHGIRRQRGSTSKGTKEPIRSASTNLRADAPEAPSLLDSTHNRAATPVENNLADTMMTTVVSNGNDALNLLFEAAQHEERGASSTRGTIAADQASAAFAASPTSPTPSTSVHVLPELPLDLLETWNAYRFVRMGWLSAEEVVWYLDM